MNTKVPALFGLAGFFLVAAVCSGARLDPVTPSDLPPETAAFFTPRDDIRSHIRKLIHEAHTSIFINEYALTDPDIALDLVQAYEQKGILVGVILEASPAITNYLTPQYLALNGINVLVYRGPTGIDNHKYIIIDRKTVLLGSYDLTRAAATRNLEDLLVITNAGVANSFYIDWITTCKACQRPDVQK